MLRTNLSTRPFYNERAVRVAIGTLIVIVSALTLFNAAQIFTLNDRNAAFATRAETAEGQAQALREQARITRDTLDKAEVGVVQAAAREANLLIERRAFSWTDLFNRFEQTLPADVRVAAIEPQIDNDGRMLIAATVVSRRVEDVDTFIDELEATGAFRAVLARQEAFQDDGTLRSTLQGYYGPELAKPSSNLPGTAAATGTPSGTSSGNGTPRHATPPTRRSGRSRGPQ
ncbi:MAG TPA: hypothetical protein VNJ02_12370 [Vicinamibacterales bacterium]|nr:hypothetical protein [Vicinamibacterales bacterium]